MRGFYDDLTCKQTWRHARTDIRSRTPAELLLIEVDYSRSIIYLLENLVCYIRNRFITMLRRSSKLFVPCLQGTLARLALPSVQPHRKYAVEVPDEHRHNFDPENPNLTKFEVVDDPEVWKYVERILPQRTIPPSPKEEGASGWKPARLTREEVCLCEFLLDIVKCTYIYTHKKDWLLEFEIDEFSDLIGLRFDIAIRVLYDYWVISVFLNICA